MNNKILIDLIKNKLKGHCEYSNELGWYLPENKIDLLLNKIIEDYQLEGE